jgi:hypothetical protein
MKRVFILMTLFLLGCQPTESTISLLKTQRPATNQTQYPTLDDFWNGSAEFIIDVTDTGLPMGESETIEVVNGHLWSYVHASWQSAEVVDQCGAPVTFPGCVVIYRSYDGGQSFGLDDPAVCQTRCRQCPCTNEVDHIGEEWAQQQYPDVAYHAPTDTLYMVYENGGGAKMRLSQDGLEWGYPRNVGDTGHFRTGTKPCIAYEVIGQHPFVPYDYDCLSGGPPGLFIEGDWVYVFVAGGQAPGHMTCYKGKVRQVAEKYQRCDNNPLFTSMAREYGPLELRGSGANPYWDFRTISSAEVLPVVANGNTNYYMVYEGIRGPGPFDGGDSQFALGIARTTAGTLDSKWELFNGNPILVDLPANVGLGHADLFVTAAGETILYTSLDGVVRSRLRLVWKNVTQ